MKRILATVAVILGLTITPFGVQSAQATTTSQRIAHAYYLATREIGCWYHYGNTGPCSYGFDCSGLVYSVYRAAGIPLPRTTYEMLGSWHLYRIRYPQRGDLAFFGSGHVEIYDGGHTTLGAQKTGTRIGYHVWSAYWHPTAFYRVR